MSPPAGEKNEALLAWLDSPLDDFSLYPQARAKFGMYDANGANSKNDDYVYQGLAQVILKPRQGSGHVQRSWRAMIILTDDLSSGNRIFIHDAVKANLLAKDIFATLASIDPTDDTSAEATTSPQVVVLHIRLLLEALLDAHPSAVVSAACSGGTEGMEAHLAPLLAAKTSAQLLPTMTHVVLYACLGKKTRASAEKTMQENYMYQQQHLQRDPSLNSAITPGHRRKFVKTLSDWSFLHRLIECMLSQEEQDDPSVGEDVCESILTIVECLGYPEKPPQSAVRPQAAIMDAGVGEDHLLAPLGQEEWWDPLVQTLLNPNTHDGTKIAATRIMMGIFTLATGHSSRIRITNPPMTDNTERNFGGPDLTANAEHLLEEAQQDILPHENKLLDWGLTSKIHQSLVSHLPQLVQAMAQKDDESSDVMATTYFDRTDDVSDIAGVAHPGRCRIVPFTSWRLHVVTLLAEVMAYNGSNNDDDDDDKQDKKKPTDEAAKALRLSAMEAVMKLPLPPNMTQGKNQDDVSAGEGPLNPWPILCDWVFSYPENAMFHYQFLRLFQSICMEHHEPTLRLVLQKSKFVSRAVRTCREKGPLRGVLVRCLNMLRLRSQSLPPSAFLRQFIQSHDAWKGFLDMLIELTERQEVSSYPIPGKEALYGKPVDLDLGSRYAVQLGFVGIKQHEETAASPVDQNEAGTTTAGTGGGKKKKRKKKPKKKKAAGAEAADEEEEIENND